MLRKLIELRTAVACAKGREVCPPERLNAYWWQVEAGAARKVLLSPSGQRCILEFLLPGEFFACHTDGRADLVIEAIGDGTIMGRYDRADIERLAREDGAIAEMVRDATVRAAFYMDNHINNLWHQRSIDKVLLFLTEMQTRLGQAPDEFFSLPMSRHDMADYLGLSIETVSRALTELKERGIIEFDGPRQVKFAQPIDRGPRRR